MHDELARVHRLRRMRWLAIGCGLAAPLLAALLAQFDRSSGPELPLLIVIYVLLPTAAIGAGVAVFNSVWPSHAALRGILAVALGAVVFAAVIVLTGLSYVFAGGSIH